MNTNVPSPVERAVRCGAGVIFIPGIAGVQSPSVTSALATTPPWASTTRPFTEEAWADAPWTGAALAASATAAVAQTIKNFRLKRRIFNIRNHPSSIDTNSAGSINRVRIVPEQLAAKTEEFLNSSSQLRRLYRSNDIKQSLDISVISDEAFRPRSGLRT